MRRDELIQRRLDQLVKLLNLEFERLGIAEQFAGEGLYADIDWQARMRGLLAQLPSNVLGDDEGVELEEAANVKVDLWRHLLEKLPAITASDDDIALDDFSPRALDDLLSLLQLPSVSQSKVIEKFRRYQELNAIEPRTSTRGKCFGLAVVKAIASLLPNAVIEARLNEDERIRFRHFDDLMRRIGTWDGEAATLDAELTADMAFFQKFVLVLHDGQNDLQPVLDRLFGEEALHIGKQVAWVFTSDELQRFAEQSRGQRPQAMLMSAHYHAGVAILPSADTPAHEALTRYYNANCAYGTVNMPFDGAFVDRLCDGISVGYSVTYPDRMPMAVELIGAGPRPAYDKAAAAALLDRMIDQRIVDTQADAPSLAALHAIKQLDAERYRSWVADVINKKAATGDTALTIAVLRHLPDQVELLLARGAQPNLKDIEGNTPLIYAVLAGNYSTVQLLLDRGADISVLDQPCRWRLMQLQYEHAEAGADKHVVLERVRDDILSGGLVLDFEDEDCELLLRAFVNQADVIEPVLTYMLADAAHVKPMLALVVSEVQDNDQLQYVKRLLESPLLVLSHADDEHLINEVVEVLLTFRPDTMAERQSVVECLEALHHQLPNVFGRQYETVLSGNDGGPDEVIHISPLEWAICTEQLTIAQTLLRLQPDCYRVAMCPQVGVSDMVQCIERLGADSCMRVLLPSMQAVVKDDGDAVMLAPGADTDDLNVGFESDDGGQVDVPSPLSAAGLFSPQGLEHPARTRAALDDEMESGDPWIAQVVNNIALTSPVWVPATLYAFSHVIEVAWPDASEMLLDSARALA